MTKHAADPTVIDETALIERTQQGEVEAFSPLVRKYHARLYRHIQKRPRDPEVAKDLTQETWLKMNGTDSQMIALLEGQVWDLKAQLYEKPLL